MESDKLRVVPFAGTRYNPEVIGDMNKVVCPPYDVISPEDRVYYHSISPYNFVRLILGEEHPEDTSEDNRFTRARSSLDNWLKESVMISENAPAMYVYRQDFTRDSKDLSVCGLIAAVRLHEYADQVILPHENTLAKPKSQLKQLLESVEANLDSVYGLYEDPEGVVQTTLEACMSTTPVYDVLDKESVRHRLWLLSDSDSLEDVMQFFADKQIAIADGHHRYETALAYSKDARARLNEPQTDKLRASDYTLMTLANVYQPDLTVLPTHRVMFGLNQQMVDSLPEALETDFDVCACTVDSLSDDMQRTNAIGMYLGTNKPAYTLKHKEGAETGIKGCEASRQLEVNILHKLVLERLLGLNDQDMRDQTNVIYTRDVAEALELVDSDRAQVAFLLNAVGVKPIMDIAAAGEKMPQKSTYFYPKLLSGLVLRLLER